MFLSALVLWRTKFNLIYDAVDESDFSTIKGAEWQSPLCDGKIASWKRFEMEFITIMQHLRLASVLVGEMGNIPVADRTNSRDPLHAQTTRSRKQRNILLCGV